MWNRSNKTVGIYENNKTTKQQKHKYTHAKGKELKRLSRTVNRAQNSIYTPREHITLRRCRCRCRGLKNMRGR